MYTRSHELKTKVYSTTVLIEKASILTPFWGPNLGCCIIANLKQREDWLWGAVCVKIKFSFQGGHLVNPHLFDINPHHFDGSRWTFSKSPLFKSMLHGGHLVNPHHFDASWWTFTKPPPLWRFTVGKWNRMETKMETKTKKEMENWERSSEVNWDCQAYKSSVAIVFKCHL